MIVYLITNLENGKQYVGQTEKSLRVRWSQHCCKAYRGSPYALHCAIRKYGRDVFEIEILDEGLTEAEADFCEVFYIRILNTKVPNGYNLTDGGEGSHGFKMPESAIEKSRATQFKPGLIPWSKGKHLSPETREKQRKAKLQRPTRYWLGKKRSSNTIEKVSNSLRGHIPWNKGKHNHLSKEQLKRLSDAQRSRNRCPRLHKSIQ